MPPKRESTTGTPRAPSKRAKKEKTQPAPLGTSDYTPTLVSTSPDLYPIVQNRVCRVWAAAGLPERCTSCIQRQNTCGSCRFNFLRAFATIDGTDNPDYSNYAWRDSQDDPPPPPTKKQLREQEQREREKKKQPQEQKKQPREQKKQPRGQKESATSSRRRATKPVDEEPVDEDEAELPQLPPSENATVQQAERALALIAPAFAGQLSREVRHEEGEVPMIRITCTPETRSLCDMCSTGVFMGSYMCGLCGKELCLGCWEEWEAEDAENETNADEKVLKRDMCSKKRRHRRSNMLFVTRAKPGELQGLLERVEKRLALGDFEKADESDADLIARFPTVTAPADDNGASYLPVPTLTHSDITLPQFQSLWAHGGIPLVLTDLLQHFKLPWDPDYFISHFGPTPCLIHDCITNAAAPSTVAAFFQRFSTNTLSHKLKDWPPTASFASTFPHLFADFETALPLPLYTRRTGPLNLASHFPPQWNAPDLGPKMYNATPARDFLPFPDDATELEKMEIVQDVRGTTNLHLDLTDAVNIMLFAAGGNRAPAESTESKHIPLCGAVWDIFPPSAASAIRAYLREKDDRIDDPIHRQLYYLAEHEIAMLKDVGVMSYRIYQEPGDAVFIPAGCPHQVRNRRSCVKVAVDFLSAENVGVCRELGEEARRMAPTSGRGGVGKEDVLQLWGCLGFAWAGLERVVEAEEEDVKMQDHREEMPGVETIDSSGAQDGNGKMDTAEEVVEQETTKTTVSVVVEAAKTAEDSTALDGYTHHPALTFAVTDESRSAPPPEATIDETKHTILTTDLGHWAKDF